MRPLSKKKADKAFEKAIAVNPRLSGMAREEKVITDYEFSG